MMRKSEAGLLERVMVYQLAGLVLNVKAVADLSRLCLDSGRSRVNKGFGEPKVVNGYT